MRKSSFARPYVAICLCVSAAFYAITVSVLPGRALTYAGAGKLCLMASVIVGAALYLLSAETASSPCEEAKDEGEKKRVFFLRAGVICAAMAARLLLFDVKTADYNTFLSNWVQAFRDGGAAALAKELGDYNLPYQYLLFLISKSSICDLYLIKLITVICDMALAVLMGHITQEMIDVRWSTAVFTAVLFNPTFLIGGAYWGQCDSIYILFVILSLYLMLRDKPIRSVICLTIAFSFKLQTIFFFPMVLFGLLHKKYQLRHALVFPLTYIVTLIPALMQGRSFASALMVYVNQSVGQYGDRLTCNAANLYQFFTPMRAWFDYNNTWMYRLLEPAYEFEYYLDERAMAGMQSAALWFCVTVVLALTAVFFIKRRQIPFKSVWMFAAFYALLIPFVMPRMHERYFYMAEIFAILYAARYRRRIAIPLLVSASSLISYMPYVVEQYSIPLWFAACMNLAALIIIAADIGHTLHVGMPVTDGEGEAI